MDYSTRASDVVPAYVSRLLPCLSTVLEVSAQVCQILSKANQDKEKKGLHMCAVQGNALFTSYSVSTTFVANSELIWAPISMPLGFHSKVVNGKA
eukprot:365627-Pelagomonas_calceolata.AAC.9